MELTPIEFISGYTISSAGEVVNLETGFIRKWTYRSGYPSVLIKKKNYHIHRLVAIHFVKNENPEKFDVVNHIDNNTKNPNYLNLEWGTHKTNHKHAIDQNRHTFQTSVNSIANRNKTGVPSKISRKASSGVQGVQIATGPRGTKYRAYFNSGGSRYLGTFPTMDLAMNAYRTAHIDKYGFDPYDGE